MKKLFSGILIAALLLGCFSGIDFTKKVSAASFNFVDGGEVVPVYQKAISSSVNLSTNTVLGTDVFTPANGVLSGSFDVQYSFTLEKNSYVNIQYNASVYESSLCYSEFYLGENPSYVNTLIGSTTTVDGDYSKATDSFETALEAGTYYLKVTIYKQSRNKEEPSFVANPCVNIGINAQKMKARTGSKTGASMKTAIPTKNGKTSYGNITGLTVMNSQTIAVTSNSITKQYFKVKLSKRKALYFALSITRPSNLSTALSYDTVIYNSAGTKVYSNTYEAEDSSNTLTDLTSALAKGTYYVEVNYPRFCEISFKPTAMNPNTDRNSIATETTNVKRCTLTDVKAKIGTKRITGRITPGALLKIRVFGKTYSGTMEDGTFKLSLKKKLKKKTKIKITVSCDGYITSHFTIKPKKK